MRHLFDSRAAARYVGSALAAAAACAALLFTPPAFSRGTNILDNVSYSTLMWSLNDPFGFDTLDLLSATATNHAARITYLEALGPGGGVEEDPVAYPISTNALAIAGASLPKTATNGWEYGAHQAWALPSITNGMEYGAHQPWLLSVPSQPYTIITNAPWALPSITNGMEYGAHQAWLLAGATNGLASTNYVNAMVSGVDLTRLLDVGNTGYVSHDGTDLSLFASTAYGTFTVVCSNVWNQSLVSPPWGMNGTVTLTASSTGASTNSGLWELSINGLYNYAGYSYLRHNGVDVWSDNRYPLNFPITMTPTAGDNGAVTITRSYPATAVKTFASLADLAAYTNAVFVALAPGAALGATSLQPASTNGLEFGSHAGFVTASVTNGLAPLSALPALTNGLGQSTLLSILTNATGGTTQQVWQTGAVVTTNFFKPASVAQVFTNGYIRPSYWPVASGYTPETWTACEVGKVKMLVIPDPKKPTVMYSAAAGTTNTWTMDWLGDGSNVSNYPCNTNVFFIYPPQYANKLVPAIATWNQTSATLTMNMTLASMTVLRTNSCVITEAIVSGTNALNRGFGLTYITAPALKAVYLYNSISPGGSGAGNFFDCVALQYMRIDNCVLGTYLALRSYALEIVDIVNCPEGLMGTNPFGDCRNLRSLSGNYRTAFSVYGVATGAGIYALDLPRMTNLVTDFVYGCTRLETLTPMPGLLTCGTRTFKNCNLDFNAITNFVLSLTNDVSTAQQTIDFSLNRGSAEFGAWLTGGGSALVVPGWSFIY